MALALRVHVCDKHLELGSYRKLPLRHFHDSFDVVRVRHRYRRTFQMEVHDRQQTLAIPNQMQLVLVEVGLSLLSSNQFVLNYKGYYNRAISCSSISAKMCLNDPVLKRFRWRPQLLIRRIAT
jgi:hypothetical protein